jgi:hypothetical protein
MVMVKNLIYVYCISNNFFKLKSDLESVGLKSIILDDFNVIVKYVSESEFSEENFKNNLSDIQWVEINAREHIRIISVLMESGTVIPFKFGTIYNTKASLIKFVTDYSDALIENFHHIKQKEEWSVKIYCNRKVMCEQIDKLSEKTAEMEKIIMASSPGKAFLVKRKKAELIENEIDSICENYGQKYYDELNNLSESTSLSNLLPKEISGKLDTMILNANFFISKNKVAEFISIVNKLRKESLSLGFIIEEAGPWPPFSFITIKEKQ